MISLLTMILSIIAIFVVIAVFGITSFAIFCKTLNGKPYLINETEKYIVFVEKNYGVCEFSIFKASKFGKFYCWLFNGQLGYIRKDSYRVDEKDRAIAELTAFADNYYSLINKK